MMLEQTMGFGAEYGLGRPLRARFSMGENTLPNAFQKNPRAHYGFLEVWHGVCKCLWKWLFFDHS